MVTVLTLLIALNCFLLMAVVLIQNPKGGGIDSTFGGQGANQMFGAARSTDFIEKLTFLKLLSSLPIFFCWFVRFQLLFHAI